MSPKFLLALFVLVISLCSLGWYLHRVRSLDLYFESLTGGVLLSSSLLAHRVYYTPVWSERGLSILVRLVYQSNSVLRIRLPVSRVLIDAPSSLAPSSLASGFDGFRFPFSWERHL